MAKVLHFINGDLPPFILVSSSHHRDDDGAPQHPAVAAAMASAAPARMEFDWQGLQLRLVSRDGKVVRRWCMESVSADALPSTSMDVGSHRHHTRGEERRAAAGSSHRGGPVDSSGTASRFFWRVTEKDETAPSQALTKKDLVYLVRPAKPQPGDLMNTPHYYDTRENHYNDTDAKKQLISGVDFRSKMGRRFAVTRKDYGSVIKAAGFSAQDVMNAVEVTANRRAAAERQRERVIAAVENGETDEAPKKKVKV